MGAWGIVCVTDNLSPKGIQTVRHLYRRTTLGKALPVFPDSTLCSFLWRNKYKNQQKRGKEKRGFEQWRLHQTIKMVIPVQQVGFLRLVPREALDDW